VLLIGQRDPKMEALKQMTDAYLKGGDVFRRALTDPDNDIRLIALKTLEELAQLNGIVRERVLNAQEKKPGEGSDLFLEPFLVKMTPEVVTNLTNDRYQVRLAATQVLESRGPQARPVAGSVVSRLGDPNLFVRWAAARILGRLSKPTINGAVDGLAKLLCDEDLSVRIAAANAIEALGIEARGAAPALLKVVNRGDADFREAAARALGVVGPYADTPPLTGENRAALIVPALAKELSNPDARVRRAAAQALGRFGADAEKYAAKELKAALADEDAEVRRNATEALLAK
jgi:HEAT repeat protein